MTKAEKDELDSWIDEIMKENGTTETIFDRMYAPNPCKCTIFWDKHIILIDPIYLESEDKSSFV